MDLLTHALHAYETLACLNIYVYADMPLHLPYGGAHPCAQHAYIHVHAQIYILFAHMQNEGK